jgi:transcriptional regulator with XRE-family HTH domain
MSEWLTQQPAHLQMLVERLTNTAPLSLKKLMDRAGMTPQSLAYWRNGRSIPQPESIEKVGQTLVFHGERLRTLGRELLQIVHDEELNRRLAQADASSENGNLSLFDPPDGPGRSLEAKAMQVSTPEGKRG